MKSESDVHNEIARILKKLEIEENPLQYIYGMAQVRALKWLLELPKHDY